MSFLRVNASIQGVVLTEFDTAFTNPYYASRFDNGSRVSADSIAATAAVLAAALHRLAGGDPQQLQVSSNGTPTCQVVLQIVVAAIINSNACHVQHKHTSPNVGTRAKCCGVSQLPAYMLPM